MNIRRFLYVKNQKLSRWLASTLSRTRSFTAMQLMLKTLRANKMLPEKLVALEVFGFIGTSVTMDYMDLAESIEMWELDPYYAKHAKKNVPKANVMCGDSIKALKAGGVLRRDYNFIVLDPNNISAFNDGSYESFGIFDFALKYIAPQAVIFVTIYTDLLNEATSLGKTEADIDQNWIKARREFFDMENVINGRGIDYLKGYERVITRNNIEIIYSQFINRNDAVGFGVFVLKKPIA